jgi:uncharacterized membrane protein YhaH (DUF805 family)
MHELLTLPEHVRSPQAFYGVHSIQSLVFCVVLIICPVAIFVTVIALYVLRFTASEYTFVFSNLSLQYSKVHILK